MEIPTRELNLFDKPAEEGDCFNLWFKDKQYECMVVGVLEEGKLLLTLVGMVDAKTREPIHITTDTTKQEHLFKYTRRADGGETTAPAWVDVGPRLFNSRKAHYVRQFQHGWSTNCGMPECAFGPYGLLRGKKPQELLPVDINALPRGAKVCRTCFPDGGVETPEQEELGI